MSVVPVGFSQLVCDGCGAAYENLDEDAISVRIKAAPDGWKFRQYTTAKGNGVPRNQKGPRQWDSCPNCDVPATSADAQKRRTA